MDVVYSASHGAHNHADEIYSLPLPGINKGAKDLLTPKLDLRQLGSRRTSCMVPVDKSPLHSILNV